MYQVQFITYHVSRPMHHSSCIICYFVDVLCIPILDSLSYIISYVFEPNQDKT